MMGHATAKLLTDNLIDSMESANLSLESLVMLEGDGPNVNKSVSKAISAKVKEATGHPLIDIGSCPLHTVHNSFGKGLLVYGEEAVELIQDIYTWFKLSAARLSDFLRELDNMDLPRREPLRHVETRWLSLSAVADARENY